MVEEEEGTHSTCALSLSYQAPFVCLALNVHVFLRGLSPSTLPTFPWGGDYRTHFTVKTVTLREATCLARVLSAVSSSPHTTEGALSPNKLPPSPGPAPVMEIRPGNGKPSSQGGELGFLLL